MGVEAWHAPVTAILTKTPRCPAPRFPPSYQKSLVSHHIPSSCWAALCKWDPARVLLYQTSLSVRSCNPSTLLYHSACLPPDGEEFLCVNKCSFILATAQWTYGPFPTLISNSYYKQCSYLCLSHASVCALVSLLFWDKYPGTKVSWHTDVQLDKKLTDRVPKPCPLLASDGGHGEVGFLRSPVWVPASGEMVGERLRHLSVGLFIIKSKPSRSLMELCDGISFQVANSLPPGIWLITSTTEKRNVNKKSMG